MNIKEVLELDPKKEYEILYSATNVWKQSYFQRKENEIDPNDLPILDNELLLKENLISPLIPPQINKKPL
jgi:hypothetical protein